MNYKGAVVKVMSVKCLLIRNDGVSSHPWEHIKAWSCSICLSSRAPRRNADKWSSVSHWSTSLAKLMDYWCRRRTCPKRVRGRVMEVGT